MSRPADDVQTLVAAAIAKALGCEAPAGAADAQARLERFAEKYARFIDAKALRARADALDMAEREPSVEDRERAERLRRTASGTHQSAKAARDAVNSGVESWRQPLRNEEIVRDWRRQADELDPPRADRELAEAGGEGDDGPEMTPEELADAARRSRSRERAHEAFGMGGKGNDPSDVQRRSTRGYPHPEYGRPHPRDNDADDLSKPADRMAESDVEDVMDDPTAAERTRAGRLAADAGKAQAKGDARRARTRDLWRDSMRQSARRAHRRDYVQPGEADFDEDDDFDIDPREMDALTRYESDHDLGAASSGGDEPSGTPTAPQRPARFLRAGPGEGYDPEDVGWDAGWLPEDIDPREPLGRFRHGRLADLRRAEESAREREAMRQEAPTNPDFAEDDAFDPHSRRETLDDLLARSGGDIDAYWDAAQNWNQNAYENDPDGSPSDTVAGRADREHRLLYGLEEGEDPGPPPELDEDYAEQAVSLFTGAARPLGSASRPPVEYGEDDDSAYLPGDLDDAEEINDAVRRVLDTYGREDENVALPKARLDRDLVRRDAYARANVRGRGERLHGDVVDSLLRHDARSSNLPDDHAEDFYEDSQPREEHGRWTAGANRRSARPQEEEGEEDDLQQRPQRRPQRVADEASHGRGLGIEGLVPEPQDIGRHVRDTVDAALVVAQAAADGTLRSADYAAALATARLGAAMHAAREHGLDEVKAVLGDLMQEAGSLAAAVKSGESGARVRDRLRQLAGEADGAVRAALSGRDDGEFAEEPGDTINRRIAQGRFYRRQARESQRYQREATRDAADELRRGVDHEVVDNTKDEAKGHGHDAHVRFRWASQLDRRDMAEEYSRIDADYLNRISDIYDAEGDYPGREGDRRRALEDAWARVMDFERRRRGKDGRGGGIPPEDDFGEEESIYERLANSYGDPKLQGGPLPTLGSGDDLRRQHAQEEARRHRGNADAEAARRREDERRRARRALTGDVPFRERPMAEGDGFDSPKARRMISEPDGRLMDAKLYDLPGRAEHEAALRRAEDDVRRGEQNREHPALKGFKGFRERRYAEGAD